MSETQPKQRADKKAAPAPSNKADQENAQWEERVKTLLKIEQEFNKKWEESHIYEEDAPLNPQDAQHYYVTFPFPYMNGRLHLGHLFTLTKAEYAVRYERMKGKHALFPFAFHCTGMPIKASADKLKLELDTGKAVISDGTHLKPKAASKVDNTKSQFQIMQMMGIPDEEIPSFADPHKWLEYFPPLGEEDLKLFGTAVDWRRSFITTDKNPYYDHFVRWQFNILYSKKLIEFGKRPTIYSIKDNQPCMDHDRSSGEGVQPQEYVLIKLQLVDPSSVSSEFPAGLPVFLLAATLRPETMIGQTNFWVKPNAKYDVVLSKDGQEVYVAGHRCVRNMFAQGICQTETPIFELSANDLLGKECTHKCIQHRIRGFPMLSILMNKGTGIVTCVPSDAPADLASLDDLKNDEKFREKWGIKKEWLDFEIIKVIDTPTYGDFTAKAALEAVKYNPNEKKESEKHAKLAEAKDLAYKDGFYKGTMKIGPFQGMKVQIAKDKMKAQMISEGSAISYYEPESEVISRSGDECVVMFCDQWYLLYGKEDWKQQIVEHFNKNVETFHSETREKFLKCFDWLGAWACSRSFGLGTHMPFSEEYLIDSLSDSTIQQAYATIAHLLQGNLDGTVVGPLGITADQCDDAFFNCVFLGGPMPAGIDPEKIKRLQAEFNFWYPCTCRVSGKDLVTNHLTMYLYNHAAIFPPDKWPTGIRANGHLKLNNKKMSKHDGNFYTVIDAINKFSSTAVRIALADGGDAADDANFTEDVAKSAANRLASFTEFVKMVPEGMRTEMSGFADELFDARISKVIKDADFAYSRMMYKAALKFGFYDLSNYWSEYTTMTDGSICSILRDRYIDTFLKVLTPIIPHYCDYIWTDLLNHETSIINEKFPQPKPYNPQIFFMDRFISKTMDQVRFKIRSLGKKIDCQDLAIFVKTEYTPEQIAILDLLKRCYKENTNSFDQKEITDAVKADPVLSKLKPNEYMPMLKFLQEAVPEFGAFLLDHCPAFDQIELIRLNESRILKQLRLKSLKVITQVVEDPLFDKKSFDEAKVFQATVNLTGPAKAAKPAKPAKGGK